MEKEKYKRDPGMPSLDKYYKFTIVITLGVYLYYLIYRVLYTINPDAMFFSLLFYYAEVHGFIALFLYFFQIWNPIQRKSLIPQSGLLVDVVITTYNEDISLIRKTALACVNMRYPHKTYILDDGDRPQMAQMARELGCGYIVRQEKIHAKAGNLNHALPLIDGEFMAIFDADSIPQVDFLEKTLGYFQDEKIAFVQTPHSYYNVDSFQFKFQPAKERIWNEQDVFYRLMMPGRDYWDSVFFAGTASVFRGKALKDIGGFATETITEDLQTTVALCKRGWRGAYHNEIVANSLAAKDLKNYHIQKLRWAEGNINLLFKDNPLFVRGLTLSQRTCFFATIFGWFLGFPKLIYFITPAIMLLTGWYPIASFDWPFIWRYLIFLTVIILGFKITSRGYGSIRYDEMYNMMNFFVLIKAILKNIFRWKSRFIVTSKGAEEPANIFDITPQLTIVILCFSGVVWGFLKLYYEVSWDFREIGIASFWAVVNGFLAFSVVKDVTVPYYKRMDFRFIGAVPVQYSISAISGSEKDLGISKNLNEYGTSLITFAPLPIDEKIFLSLHLGRRVLDIKGTVIYTVETNPLQGKMFNYGIKFEGLTRKETDVISQFCFNVILPGFLQRIEKKESFFMKMTFWYYNRKRIQKRSPRKRNNLPLVVKTDPPFYAVTNDISASGISFICFVPLELRKQLMMEVFTPFGKIITKGDVGRMREVVKGQSYLISTKFLQFFGQSEDILSKLTQESHQKVSE